MTGTQQKTKKTRKELKFAHAAKMKAKREARGRVVLPVYANKTPRIGDRTHITVRVPAEGQAPSSVRGGAVHGAIIDDANFLPPSKRAATQDRFVPLNIPSAADELARAKELSDQRKKLLRQELETILEAKPEFKPSYDSIHRLIAMSDGNTTEGAERRVFLTYDAEPIPESREIGQALWDQGGINLMHFALLCVDAKDQGELSASWDKIGDWRA